MRVIIKSENIFEEAFIMKVTKIFTAVITAMLTLSTVQAAEIPRESAPLNATEEQIVIVENLYAIFLMRWQRDSSVIPKLPVRQIQGCERW